MVDGRREMSTGLDGRGGPFAVCHLTAVRVLLEWRDNCRSVGA